MGTGPAADEHSAELDSAEFDIVVAGSGAAGMTAALTAAHRGATVVVLEKTGLFGGSTARSGGGIWAPGNTVLRRAGVADTPELARSYLARVAGEDVPAELRDALLEHGPAMLDFVLAATPLRLAWVPGYADYYPEAPGGLASGRSVEPVPFNGSVLGRELARLNRPYLPVPNGVAVTQADYRWLTLGPRHPRAVLAGMRVAGRVIRSRLLGQRMLSLGQALAAGLRAGLLAREVPVWLDCPLTDLVVTDGRVTGIRALRDGKPVLIRARRGVLIATGGFERNEQLRRQYQQAPIGTDWTTGATGNTGDGIVAGQRLGAATGLMDDAWWGPSIPLPRGPYFCLAERNLPGCLMVNGAGRRFVNESAPYVDAVHAMYAGNAEDNPHIPAWLVFDQRYRDRYVFAGLPPGRPLPRRWYAAGAVFRAPDLGKLAAAIGVDPDGLAQTVARFNEFARAGRDEEFHRGESAYDRYYGDPRVRPNPNLAPLARAPFYAAKIVPGDLGTKGGLRTDGRARVLRPDGTLIPGLYAAGNASASVMGHSYAGAGATIGPAMTFGYLAALDLTADAAGLSGVTVRHTGIRVEELTELSHHSVAQYRLPSTGEMVPLLSIAPSKKDAERLLVIGPELADALSAIITRVRGTSGAVPLTPAWDPHERTRKPPMPLLFQRVVGLENRPISADGIPHLLTRALAASGITGTDGKPLTFWPHDFRRVFTTDAILNGMPPHIAQLILGHDDINTTMGHKAVYPEEAIRGHRAFIAQRRATRPGEEYRTPTDAEWDEFLGHFQRRRVALGDCGRAYSTPCIHEHSCVRCPLLRIDPAQRHRLEEIRDNLHARITEAEREGWTGEAEGLKVSLTAATSKIAQADATTARRAQHVHLGIPAYRDIAATTLTTEGPREH